MKRLALAIVFVLGFAPPAWADFQAGLAAYDRGDYATAAREFRPLAEQGFTEVQFILGTMYYIGQGVPQDYAEAVKWFQLAAKQGDAGAQFGLGGMFYHGQGVPQDYAAAVKWYRLAAKQGVASAQFGLGAMYNNGQGVAQNYAEALKWYWKAAEQGKPSAQINLGVMYQFGQGVPQDYVQAHKWYNLAASRLPSGEDRDLAVKNRDIVAPKMTAAQIAEAQRLARDSKPKTQAAPTYDFQHEDEARAFLHEFYSLLRQLEPADLKESERVRGVQLNLATLGYKPGPADGILGSRTKSAIEAFQRDQGLPATGEVSAKMRFVLLREMARQKVGLAPTKVELSD